MYERVVGNVEAFGDGDESAPKIVEREDHAGTGADANQEFLGLHEVTFLARPGKHKRRFTRTALALGQQVREKGREGQGQRVAVLCRG